MRLIKGLASRKWSIGRVYRLMKSMQLPKMSTHRSHGQRMKNYICQAENILRRQFNPPAPNMVWVSDITLIRTAKGHVYLCVIIDLFARKVIAWAVRSSSSTKFAAELLLRAWRLIKNPKSVIFHSDIGNHFQRPGVLMTMRLLNLSSSSSRKKR